MQYQVSRRGVAVGRKWIIGNLCVLNALKCLCKVFVLARARGGILAEFFQLLAHVLAERLGLINHRVLGATPVVLDGVIDADPDESLRILEPRCPDSVTAAVANDLKPSIGA